MAYFNPVDLSNWCEGEWRNIPDSHIEGFCIDSRTIGQNELFIALKANRDGHLFIDQAISSGSIGAIVDHSIERLDFPQLIVKNTLTAFQMIAKAHRENFSGKVVGITGSCGKTSTKEILGLLVEASHCTQGNLNNYLGVPLTLSKLDPDYHKAGVVEAGINMPNEMDLLTDMINPDICVITSIEHSHLAGLGTIEEVAKEKIKLWIQAKQSCLGIFPEELLQFEAFSNAFSEVSKEYILVKNQKILGNDLRENQVFYEVSTETNERGHSHSLIIKRCGCPPLVTTIPHASVGIIRNMVLAAVAAWKLGITDKEICERLPQYRPSGLRGSCLVGRGCSYVLDCYNANPASMVDSIHFFFEKYSQVPKLLVLGGMNELGDSSELLHQQTGKSIHLEPSDQAVLIGKYVVELANGMIENGALQEQISILPDAESARPLIEEFKGAVLIKGSRSYQLERLIPQWAVEEIEPIKIAC